MNLRRTLVKLTLGYLALIMLVSGFLSYAVYRVSSSPLERRLQMNERILIIEPPPPEFPHRFDPGAVHEVKRNIGLSLVYFNIAVLFLAGILSYWLAKRELTPMQEAFDLQSRFTSDAAHELRTPLTAMRTEIEVALRGGELSPGEVRELLESSIEEIGKLESLSNSLLKLAQYEEATGAVLGNVALKDVVDAAVERVGHSAESAGIAVETGGEDVEIPGDRASLVELLVILVDNSVKYSEAGTTVKVSTAVMGRHAVITVADQGLGISPEDLGHVFDRFYRGKFADPTRRVEGYGLGLSIARRIAEMHRGTVDIRSVQGSGTTVTARLPLTHYARRSPHGPRAGSRLEVTPTAAEE
ncbi:MAG: HAMP domain-containing histidine kinase [Actinobacteria bacterium]|nr:HAMP domain-containing histidine kinase [Actinomycetota bacterium]MBU1943219.1 HAMP domain-containing histidine kinase [Actinomycetota bacterium]MBU2686222.1 HAMP domain-containing histidine kinase [Actinomycetota bacterium]